MKTKIITIIVLIIVVVAAAVLIGSRDNSGVTETDEWLNAAFSQETGVQTSTSTDGLISTTTLGISGTAYTMAQIAAHKTPTDCWTVVRGNVYELTKWIATHPGGEEAIISLCGIDGTTAFEGQHDGQSKPEQKLASFKIGTVAK
jgi:cytochrome b involved in lipid metabolism